MLCVNMNTLSLRRGRVTHPEDAQVSLHERGQEEEEEAVFISVVNTKEDPFKPRTDESLAP